MRTATAATAFVVGLALIAYPFSLAPLYPNVLPIALTAGIGLAVTLAFRLETGAAITGALIGLEYAVGLLSGGSGPDPFAALFAVGLLLCLELSYLACAERADVEDPEGWRRRHLFVLAVILAGSVAALIAQLAGTIGHGAGRWVVVVSIACGLTALGLIASLARRTVGASGDTSSRP